MIIAGVNGGGTKTEAICCDETGRIIGRHVAGPSNYHNVGIDAAAIAIGESISKACGSKPDRICIALAAMNSDSDYRAMLGRLSRDYSSLVLEHDAFAELYSEERGRPGVIAIAGTGSVVMGYDGRSRHRKGDMGWFLGDEGSGYFIGRQALRAAASMVFEGGEKTSLTGGIVAHLGLSGGQQIMEWVYSPSNTVSAVASISKPVEEAALMGDAVALRILGLASSNLAGWACEAAGIVGVKVVYTQGGIFSIRHFSSSFSGMLLRSGIAARPVRGSAAMGALLMAADAAGIKLAEGSV